MKPKASADTFVFNENLSQKLARALQLLDDQQCGETYADEATTRRLEAIVDEALRAGVVVIQEYQAV